MSDAAPAVICPYCSEPAKLVTGAKVYPHREDLAEKLIWLCETCDARVGCHGHGSKPLGTLANAELRKARQILHNEMIDPLWKRADQCGLYTPEDDRARFVIRKAARGRVYSYVAEKLGITREQAHGGMFDLEQCRAAWRSLKGVTYPQIRDWAKARKVAEAA